MPSFIYYIVCAVLSIAVLVGISLMSKVKTAVMGNQISSLATALAIIVTLIYFNIFPETSSLMVIVSCIVVGTVVGLYLAKKVKMIQMPELVGLLNGVGGAASALVGGGAMFTTIGKFPMATAEIALIIGSLTLTGSLVAAGKLSNKIDGRPVVWKGHRLLTSIPIAILMLTLIASILFQPPILVLLLILLPLSAFLGIAVAIRVGGADMPITISLLNSFSGVAGAIAGMAIGDVLLVAVGGIVGASGLLLTQIMCRAMNRSLISILSGTTSVKANSTKEATVVEEDNSVSFDREEPAAIEVLNGAKKVIIVPGYGMALAQAQHLVKSLSVALEKNGAEVKFAIHPVAGRMPGHLNVLLSEANVDYEQLFEMDVINEEFSSCDVCIVVGANDVLNPAARDAEGTPIYGMPILNVDKAKHIIFCNRSLKPGYAGVDNPLYQRKHGVSLLLGDASETLENLLKEFNEENRSKIVTSCVAP